MKTFYNIIYSIIVVSVFYLIVYTISNHRNNKAMKLCYINEYCIIKNTGTSIKQFKSEQTIIKSIFICRASDTTSCCEINSTNIFLYENNTVKWDSLYYNSKIGDTIFFKFINKNRFFKLK